MDIELEIHNYISWRIGVPSLFLYDLGHIFLGEKELNSLCIALGKTPQTVLNSPYKGLKVHYVNEPTFLMVCEKQRSERNEGE